MQFSLHHKAVTSHSKCTCAAVPAIHQPDFFSTSGDQVRRQPQYHSATLQGCTLRVHNITWYNTEMHTHLVSYRHQKTWHLRSPWVWERAEHPQLSIGHQGGWSWDKDQRVVVRLFSTQVCFFQKVSYPVHFLDGAVYLKLGTGDTDHLPEMWKGQFISRWANTKTTMKEQQKQISLVSYSASLVQLNNCLQYREMKTKAELPGARRWSGRALFKAGRGKRGLEQESSTQSIWA